MNSFSSTPYTSNISTTSSSLSELISVVSKDPDFSSISDEIILKQNLFSTFKQLPLEKQAEIALRAFLIVQSKLKSVDAQLNKLKKESEEKYLKTEAIYNHMIDKLNDANCNKKLEIQKLENEIEVLKSNKMVSELEEKVKKYKGQISLLDKKLKDYENEKDEKNNDYNSLQKNHEIIKKDHKTLKIKLEKEENEKREINEENKKMKAMIAKLEEKIKQLEKEIKVNKYKVNASSINMNTNESNIKISLEHLLCEKNEKENKTDETNLTSSICKEDNENPLKKIVIKQIYNVPLSYSKQKDPLLNQLVNDDSDSSFTNEQPPEPQVPAEQEIKTFDSFPSNEFSSNNSFGIDSQFKMYSHLYDYSNSNNFDSSKIKSKNFEDFDSNTLKL